MKDTIIIGFILIIAGITSYFLLSNQFVMIAFIIIGIGVVLYNYIPADIHFRHKSVNLPIIKES